MQSKRVSAGSLIDAQKAETFVVRPPLDMQRAESSKQHVRALNTQFASWVQGQLQNHPDELWEDGVQDYLEHAKSIIEKFSDVVDWLKANAAKGDSQMKPASEIEKSCHKIFLDKSVFPAATTANLGTSWTPGNLFSNSGPFTFGGTLVSGPGSNSIGPNHGASDDGDGGDDEEQPSSPSVKKSKEMGVLTVHEVKCKLYVKSSDPAEKEPWKDKGVGQLSIKCKEGVSKGTKESKPTIVIRNDVGKVLLNALLYPGIKTNLQKNSVVAIFHTSGEGSDSGSVFARTFLMKTKTEDDRDKLAATIKEHAPEA